MSDTLFASWRRKMGSRHRRGSSIESDISFVSSVGSSSSDEASHYVKTTQASQASPKTLPKRPSSVRRVPPAKTLSRNPSSSSHISHISPPLQSAPPFLQVEIPWTGYILSRRASASSSMGIHHFDVSDETRSDTSSAKGVHQYDHDPPPPLMAPWRSHLMTLAASYSSLTETPDNFIATATAQAHHNAVLGKLGDPATTEREALAVLRAYIEQVHSAQYTTRGASWSKRMSLDEGRRGLLGGRMAVTGVEWRV